MCADNWLDRNKALVSHRINNRRKESDKFVNFMSDIFEEDSKNIGAFDCEFFYGASNKCIRKQMNTKMEINEDLFNLLPLYNIGITSSYMTNNILVKHPCFSIKERYNMFKNKYNEEKMFKYLQNCVYYSIRMETNINICKQELDLDAIDYYFEMLGLSYSQIILILDKYCEQDVTLLYHYCEKDYAFIYYLCNLMQFQDINKISFYNTREFCHVVFPMNNVVSHSLSYFIDNLIVEQKRRPNDLHVAVYDAEMLLILFKRLIWLFKEIIQ